MNSNDNQNNQLKFVDGSKKTSFATNFEEESPTYIKEEKIRSYNSSDDEETKKKINKKLLMIIIGAVFFIVAVILLILLTTSNKEEYTSKDVKYNCTISKNSNEITKTTKLEVLLDFNGYQLVEYRTDEYKFSNLTNEIYENELNKIIGPSCIKKKGISKNMECGKTTLGYNTTIKRSGNTMTIKYSNKKGDLSHNYSLTKQEELNYISALRKQGFTCN